MEELWLRLINATSLLFGAVQEEGAIAIEGLRDLDLLPEL